MRRETRDATPRQRENFYDLNDEEMVAMRIVGTFRAVEVRDLPASVDRAVRKGLMKRGIMIPGQVKRAVEYVTLTGKGRSALESKRDSADGQQYFSGVPKQIEHDLAVYPAFRQEAQEIEREGGKITRVVLDYEFRRGTGAVMAAREGPPVKERRDQLAHDLDLPVVDGKLAIPDLRIEYEDAGGDARHLDVEVVTRHYHGAHMAGRAKTGFKLMSADGPRKMPKDDHHLGWL